MGKKTKGKGKQAALAQRPQSGAALASDWPVYEVLLSRGWQKQGELVTVLVARRAATGRVAAATFLGDLACLGVKDSQVRFYKTVDEYHDELRAHVLGQRPMEPASFDLAAKIVQTAVDYAESLGFRPHAVYAQSRHLLAGADPAADPTPVSTGGLEGKPWFIAGPYDDVPRIIAYRTRRLGEGNFHYMVGM